MAVVTPTQQPSGDEHAWRAEEPGRPGPRPGLLDGLPLRLLGLLLCLVLLGGVLVASVVFGAKEMPFSTVVDAVTQPDTTVDDHIIVRELRVPRTALGLLVGLALGLAGATMQGVTRNPSADPGLLGVDAGAALFVVVGIYVFDLSSLLAYVWFAFAGAAAASVVVYGLGSLGREGATPVKLALAGAAVTALLASFTSAVLIIDLATLDQFRFWAVGSLAGRDADVVWQVLPFIVVGGVLALASGRLLNALSLGDDVARSLGQRVGLARGLSAASVVLLCGAATAAAGPIGFVGLVVPHVPRAITGPDYRWVLPYSAVLGAVLLLGADTVGRVVARPGEVQVGIVTAIVGAPFFVALVRRRKLAEL